MSSAKACLLAISKEQCTLEVGGDLICLCPTYVNPDNADAVSSLEGLEQQWNAMSCGDNIGIACACAAPTSSNCMAGGADGNCVDVF